jgi:hypothetical protein
VKNEVTQAEIGVLYIRACGRRWFLYTVRYEFDSQIYGEEYLASLNNASIFTWDHLPPVDNHTAGESAYSYRVVLINYLTQWDCGKRITELRQLSRVHLSKIAMTVEGTSFLEHRVSTLVVAIQPESARAICDFIFWKDPKGIALFKIVVIFYHKFIPNFVVIDTQN